MSKGGEMRDRGNGPLFSLALFCYCCCWVIRRRKKKIGLTTRRITIWPTISCLTAFVFFFFCLWFPFCFLLLFFWAVSLDYKEKSLSSLLSHSQHIFSWSSSLLSIISSIISGVYLWVGVILAYIIIKYLEGRLTRFNTKYNDNRAPKTTKTTSLLLSESPIHRFLSSPPFSSPSYTLLCFVRVVLADKAVCFYNISFVCCCMDDVDDEQLLKLTHPFSVTFVHCCSLRIRS